MVSRFNDMQPQLDHFLTRYQQHQAELAGQETPEQTFAKEQFQGVVTALQSATKAMTSFMQAYHPQVTVENFPGSVKTPDVKEVVSAVKSLQKSIKPVDNSDIVKLLSSLQAEIKKLPGAMPQDDDSEEIAAIHSLSTKLDTVIAAIKAQKVTVQAPKVTVQPTPVQVQPTDVKGIVKALKDVQQEVAQKPVPGTPNIPTDPLIYYLPGDIDDAGSVQYFGYTDNRGAWYIRQFDTSVSPKTIRFAFGQSNYTTNWANRAGLTYQVWGS